MKEILVLSWTLFKHFEFYVGSTWEQQWKNLKLNETKLITSPTRSAIEQLKNKVFCLCFFSLQVETWPTQPYQGIPLTFHPQARAATQPPHLLEWFLVSWLHFFIFSSECPLCVFNSVETHGEVKTQCSKNSVATNLEWLAADCSLHTSLCLDGEKSDQRFLLIFPSWMDALGWTAFRNSSTFNA